ncbi:hypothetical protein Tco_0588542, partial [Tanacetum coccineum]
VMYSASYVVTYTSVYTDSEPSRVFWGADDEETAVVTEVTTADALYQETQTQMQETKVVSTALDALNECR